MSDFDFSLEEILSKDFNKSVLRAHKRKMIGTKNRIKTTKPSPGGQNTLAMSEVMMNQGLTNSFSSIGGGVEQSLEPFFVTLLGMSDLAYDIFEPFIPTDIKQLTEDLNKKGKLAKRRGFTGASVLAQPATYGGGAVSVGNHVIPVEGVGPGSIKDTQGQARSFGGSHKGCDIYAAEGTNVLACVGGIVAAAGQARDYDYRIRIKTTEDAGPFGPREHFYDHLKNIQVIEGQAVTTGQVIAQVGVVHDNVPSGQLGVDRHLHFSNNKVGGSETNDINIAHWLITGEYKAR